MNLTPDDMSALRRIKKAAIDGEPEARKRIKNAARSVEHAEHRETVEGCVDALKEHLREDPEARQDPHHALSEACDGMIIGYSTAEAYLRASENADAWAENIGGDDPGPEARATYALQTDVMGEVGDLHAFAESVRDGGDA